MLPVVWSRFPCRCVVAAAADLQPSRRSGARGAGAAARGNSGRREQWSTVPPLDWLISPTIRGSAALASNAHSRRPSRHLSRLLVGSAVAGLVVRDPGQPSVRVKSRPLRNQKGARGQRRRGSWSVRNGLCAVAIVFSLPSSFRSNLTARLLFLLISLFLACWLLFALSFRCDRSTPIDQPAAPHSPIHSPPLSTRATRAPTLSTTSTREQQQQQQQQQTSTRSSIRPDRRPSSEQTNPSFLSLPLSHPSPCLRPSSTCPSPTRRTQQSRRRAREQTPRRTRSSHSTVSSAADGAARVAVRCEIGSAAQRAPAHSLTTGKRAEAMQACTQRSRASSLDCVADRRIG